MPPRWKVWTALGAVDVIWGSTYLAIAYVVDGLPTLLTAGVRFLLAAGLLALLVLVRKGTAPFRASRKAYLSSTAIGLLLLLGGNGGVVIAEDRGLPSGLTALLIAAVPLYVVVLRVIGSDRPTPRTLLGVAIGFLGLALLLLPGTRPSGISVAVAVIPLIGSFLWAFGSVLASRIELPQNQLVTVAAQMLGGGAGLVIAGLLRGESLDTGTINTPAVVAFGYLVVFGSLVAFTAYSWLLSNVPVSKVATYAYVNPIVAVLLGALFLKEELTAMSALGGLITIIAVAVVVSEAPQAAIEPEAQEPELRQGRLRSSDT